MTHENRIEYVRKALITRMKEFQLQCNAIKRGICQIVPEALLNMVSYKEFEEFIYGPRGIDVELLKRNTEYRDSYKDTQNSPQIAWFWQLLREMS
jgi:hypothetical protein